ncbi:hypothetical protein Nepgr_011571 [Nepenthes gracilis]|uniref:Uncharacterized protein n=1 Tax=Nepenthes gracilis TaxID=150966 RepID=A0AAD3SFD7_NEPGR|nr:hypothetical protein Nepgr_011571 [Nepenthes gracilis]
MNLTVSSSGSIQSSETGSVSPSLETSHSYGKHFSNDMLVAMERRCEDAGSPDAPRKMKVQSTLGSQSSLAGSPMTTSDQVEEVVEDDDDFHNPTLNALKMLLEANVTQTYFDSLTQEGWQTVCDLMEKYLLVETEEARDEFKSSSSLVAANQDSFSVSLLGTLVSSNCSQRLSDRRVSDAYSNHAQEWANQNGLSIRWQRAHLAWYAWRGTPEMSGWRGGSCLGGLQQECLFPTGYVSKGVLLGFNIYRLGIHRIGANARFDSVVAFADMGVFGRRGGSRLCSFQKECILLSGLLMLVRCWFYELAGLFFAGLALAFKSHSSRTAFFLFGRLYFAWYGILPVWCTADVVHLPGMEAICFFIEQRELLARLYFARFVVLPVWCPADVVYLPDMDDVCFLVGQNELLAQYAVSCLAGMEYWPVWWACRVMLVVGMLHNADLAKKKKLDQLMPLPVWCFSRNGFSSQLVEKVGMVFPD